MSVTMIDRWVSRGMLDPYDAALARLLASLEHDTENAAAVDPPIIADLFDAPVVHPALAVRDAVSLAAALASHAIGAGHVCLDLRTIAGKTASITMGDEAWQAPDLSSWRTALQRSSVVGEPGSTRPLILDQRDRLYLHRYWSYEDSLARGIDALVHAPTPNVDATKLAAGIARWFGMPGATVDAQRIAAACAVLQPLCVISGGPGTGKTTTVGRCIALLLDQYGPGFRIVLAAPTGKAAARLQQSLRTIRSTLALAPELEGAFPVDVSTLHRLLGPIPGSVFFRHHRGAPIAADCVIVDEASMVDLALAAKLVDALPKQCRLILLGDKDQLASVEAGAVMASLCAGARRPRPVVAAALQAATGVAVAAGPSSVESLCDCVVLLDRSYRFDPSGGIGRLARAIQAGESALAVTALQAGEGEAGGQDSAVRLVEASQSDMFRVAMEGFADYLAVNWATADAASSDRPVDEPVRRAFAALNRFRILTPHRRGRFGVEALNAAISERVQRTLSGPGRALEWYAGRAVMVAANDYTLRLFNGDLGIALRDPDAEGELRVFFEAADGTLRRIAPARLPALEDAFALTVHKSQGSEFERVLLVLPSTPDPAITRELLYTAVTRASRQVSIIGPLSTFLEGIKRSQRRDSGLADKLFGAED